MESNKATTMNYEALSKKIKVFADGVRISQAYVVFAKEFNIQGFTVNPTLLVKNLETKVYSAKCGTYVRVLNKMYGGLPISVPVLCEGTGIIIQAGQINKWGENIYVKIPIIDTKGNSNIDIIKKVLKKGIRVNITCIFTPEQVRDLCFINSTTPIIVSVFAGRIADAGIDPCKIIWHIKNTLHGNEKSNVEILWASTREIYNIVQAIQSGCDIITIGEDLLKKTALLGKDLYEFSRETVQQFQNDSKLLEL